MSILLRKELLPYTTTEYDVDLDEPVSWSAANDIEWIVPERYAAPPVLPDFEDIGDIVRGLESEPGWAGSLSRARQSLASADIVTTRLSGLARLRLAKGYSQARLGQLAGTSQSHIARIENGRGNPELDTMQRIAEALQVPVLEVVAVISDSRE